MERPPFLIKPCSPINHAVLARVSPGCPPHQDRSLTCYSPVRRSTHLRRDGLPRLACVKHAASVRPEPGSNSPIVKSEQLCERNVVVYVRNLPLSLNLAVRSCDRHTNRGKVHPRTRPTRFSSRPWFSNNGRPPYPARQAPRAEDSSGLLYPRQPPATALVQAIRT